MRLPRTRSCRSSWGWMHLSGMRSLEEGALQVLSQGESWVSLNTMLALSPNPCCGMSPLTQGMVSAPCMVYVPLPPMQWRGAESFWRSQNPVQQGLCPEGVGSPGILAPSIECCEKHIKVAIWVHNISLPSWKEQRCSETLGYP